MACDLENDPWIASRCSWEIGSWLDSQLRSLLEDVFLLIGLARGWAVAFQPGVSVWRNVSLRARSRIRGEGEPRTPVIGQQGLAASSLAGEQTIIAFSGTGRGRKWSIHHYPLRPSGTPRVRGAAQWWINGLKRECWAYSSFWCSWRSTWPRGRWKQDRQGLGWEGEG